MGVSEELRGKRIAVVGASNDPSKFGFKVFKDLFDKGFDVVPVNPKIKSLLGVDAKANLMDFESAPYMVVTIVPPSVTEKICEQVVQAGIQNVWIQPGSESERAMAYLMENDINVRSNRCIMVETEYKDGNR